MQRMWIRHAGHVEIMGQKMCMRNMMATTDYDKCTTRWTFDDDEEDEDEDGEAGEIEKD